MFPFDLISVASGKHRNAHLLGIQTDEKEAGCGSVSMEEAAAASPAGSCCCFFLRGVSVVLLFSPDSCNL